MDEPAYDEVPVKVGNHDHNEVGTFKNLKPEKRTEDKESIKFETSDKNILDLDVRRDEDSEDLIRGESDTDEEESTSVVTETCDENNLLGVEAQKDEGTTNGSSQNLGNSKETLAGNAQVMQALAAFGLFKGAELLNISLGATSPESLSTFWLGNNVDKNVLGKKRKLPVFTTEKCLIEDEETSSEDLNENNSDSSSLMGVQTANPGGDNLLCCSFCGYSTKLKCKLNIHLMKHEVSKNFTCTECSYTTSRSSDLKKHFRIHTGEKPFKCEECDYRSTELGALRKHMLIHSCDKPHCCPHCDYVSPRIGDLKRHLHIHSDEKPHACQFCDYKAAQLQHLRKHMLVHTGIKPYQCTYCDYRCREPRNLKTHIQTHTGDRPYACPHCHYKAGRLGTLRRHISSIHPPEPTPIPEVTPHFLVGTDN